MLLVLFQNHDFTKIQVNHSTVLNLVLFSVFIFLILITLRKTINEKSLSVLQTNQMKGLAIIIIVITHLSYHTLKNHTSFVNSIFSGNGGFVGVSLFLILSGFGLSISIEKKGIKSFFSKRFIKICIPVLLTVLLEISLIHIFSLTSSNLLFDFGKIFYNLASIDRNLWFIIFLIFWYCMIYLIFWLNLSRPRKVIFLFSISLIVLSFPEVSDVWKMNAFSFPVGCLLGLNSEFVTKKIENILNQNIGIVLVLSLWFIFLFKIIYSFSCKPFFKNVTLDAVLIFSLVTITCLFYTIKIKSESKNYIESIFLFLAITIVYFNCFNWFLDQNAFAYILRSISAIFGATSIFFLISLMVRFNLYSYFLNFIGEISFELYLLHGMFMYSFDFLLFRGEINITFFVYFTAICVASLFFKNLNSIIYNSLLNKLKNSKLETKI